MFTAHPVEWRIPIGCDFSGFFVEVALGFIPVLRPHIAELYLLQTRCSDDFLSLLPAAEAEAYLGSQVADHDRSVAQTHVSIAIEHGNPCLMRSFERRPVHVVARLMSEGYLPPDQLHCARQADSLWVPTAWHASLLERQGLPRNRLHVVPEVVDTQLFRPAAQACDAAAAAKADATAAGAAASSTTTTGCDGFSFLSVFVSYLHESNPHADSAPTGP